MGFYLTIYICAWSFITLAIFGPSIAGFVIANNSMNDTCSDSVLIRLPGWLIVNGAFNIALFTICMFAFIVLITRLDGSHNHIFPFMTGWYIVFQIAWTICGAISLFDPLDLCRTLNYQLYSITLASLIIGWSLSAIGVIFIAIYVSSIRK